MVDKGVVTNRLNVQEKVAYGVQFIYLFIIKGLRDCIWSTYLLEITTLPYNNKIMLASYFSLSYFS